MSEERYVIKRNKKKETFDIAKIDKAIIAAYNDVEGSLPPQNILDGIHKVLDKIYDEVDKLSVENIQDAIENYLMGAQEFKVAKSYILYREKHKELRFIKDRVDYMDKYADTTDNAATASETDANANVAIKNVANLDGEVYKTTNREIQRYRMRKELEKEYPNDPIAYQYEKDLEHHIIYTHDEASSPSIKNYCEAVSLYPLLVDGTKGMDGLGTTAPKNLNSFCGQLVNLTFLLSSQCKGAVAFGEFFNFLDYFCVQDFGEKYNEDPNAIVSEKPKRTVLQAIHQAYQQIVYGWNQPAGNRSYQSPFTNISYYDKNYWHALFDEFRFPDGSQPKWERVDFLQKDFMQWFNKERTKTLLTFPVETMALLSDGKDIIDQDYKLFTNTMYSKGHSFFTYISDNPNALASCCFEGSEVIKVKNDQGEEYFISIEDYVNSFESTVNNKGLEINTGDFIKSYNINNENEYAEINGILKRNYSGDMYEFEVDHNKIKVTGDHIMMVKNINTDKIEELPAREIFLNKDIYLIAIED